LENKGHWGNAAALVLTPTAESAFKSDYASTKSTFLRSGRARAHTLSVANKLPIEMSAHRANLKDQSQSIEHSRTRVVLYVCVCERVDRTHPLRHCLSVSLLGSFYVRLKGENSSADSKRTRARAAPQKDDVEVAEKLRYDFWMQQF